MQISEGELLAGKSILDSTLRQLDRQLFVQGSEEIEGRREALVDSIRSSFEEIK
jgi:hypothetical protein